MCGMYPSAGVLFLCEQPATRVRAITTAAGAERLRRAVALYTDHPHFHGSGSPQDSENPLLVPARPVLGHVEAEAVVREIAVEDRRVQIGEAARQDERGQGHRSPEEHAAFEHDRHERRERDERFSANIDWPIE